MTFQLAFEDFQRRGIADLSGEHVPGSSTAALKALSLKDYGLMWGMESRPLTEEPRWGVGEEKDFIGHMGLDWESVEVYKGGGDMLPVLSLGENSGS